MESDAHKAIKLGLTHQGIQYRGSSSNDGAENKLVRVSRSHLLLEDADDLCNGLMKSLRYCGVVQLKRYTKDGCFEEVAVAILDCCNTDGKEYQRLDRMLYDGVGPIHIRFFLKKLLQCATAADKQDM